MDNSQPPEQNTSHTSRLWNRYLERRASDRKLRWIIISDFYRNYFNFSGRTKRTDFWFIFLYNLSTSGLCLRIDEATFHTPEASFGPLFLLWTLGNIVPTVSLYFRRLHDSDRTGLRLTWALTIAGIIPVIYWLGFSPSSSGLNKFDAGFSTSGPGSMSPTGFEGASLQQTPLAVTPHTQTTASDLAPSLMLERLEQLAHLRQQGILTDEEFLTQKKLILGM